MPTDWCMPADDQENAGNKIQQLQPTFYSEDRMYDVGTKV